MSRKKVHAWYALRRTLPPWSFEENLKELKKVLKKYRVDELIVKIDTEEFFHGQPSLEWAEKYRKNLFAVKKAMSQMGIVYSINPWITVGHCDRGRNSKKYLPGLRTMVGHDGVECTCCACPLSETWRKNTAEVWSLYAKTKPRVVWIEDDIRSFNHKPVKYGCFCDEHLKRFSERIGSKVTREELVAAMLSPGEPHPWRREYLDMQAEIMIDTVRFLAETVHRISPDSSLGLMSSGPRNHCLEGRRWKEFCNALADGKALYSRPPMGNYSESSPRGLYFSHDSIKLTRSCVPKDVGAIEQSEIESFPFTRYSKSVDFTFVETALSFAYGTHGVTLNLYDHCGTPLETEACFGKMLGKRKKYLEALAAKCQLPGEYRGVKLLFSPKSSFYKKLPPGSEYGKLADDSICMMYALESHGIPTTYADSDTVAASGQNIAACSDEEIKSLLSGGLLLDAVSAQILFERGFGKHIGLESIEPPKPVYDIGGYSTEEFYNKKFGGAPGKFLTLNTLSPEGYLKFSSAGVSDNAQIISQIVDPDAERRHIAMYAFENESGGRIAVQLYDLASAYGRGYNHTFRAEQLKGVINWLSRQRCPVVIEGDGVYPLAFRKDCCNTTLLGFFNLSLDPWNRINFRIYEKRVVKEIKMLDENGKWKKSKAVSLKRKNDTALNVRYNGSVFFNMPLLLAVEYKK